MLTNKSIGEQVWFLISAYDLTWHLNNARFNIEFIFLAHYYCSNLTDGNHGTVSSVNTSYLVNLSTNDWSH